jgi:circadian clock protein KaiC
MADSLTQSPALERIPTGIPGLDAVLHGGFFRGGIYLILGSPGTGKTIMGNQISFHHVTQGGRVAYVTLLAETHARMLSHIRSLSFFDPEPVADSLYYVSGYRVLHDAGLQGLLDLLRSVIRERRATVLILDGLTILAEFIDSGMLFRQFIHELQVYTEALGCTTFLLAPETGGKELRFEYTMVDGSVELLDRVVGAQAIRELEVRKLRGSGYLRGRHFFDITGAGIHVYPRTEALLATPAPTTVSQRGRLPFGIPRLDEMLHGGLLSSSTTLLFGAPGSGKSILGLHFLTAGARVGEPGLYFGFYDPPPWLIAKADQVGLNFDALVRAGTVELLWQPPLEVLLDPLAERLLSAVRRRQVRRLFIDGLGVFRAASIYPERIGPFLAALINELRTLDVTTVISLETAQLFTPEVIVPMPGAAETVDNIIFLRYVELRSQLYRLLSIMKVHDSGYDAAIREFKIGPTGIDMAPTFESAEAILTGVARPTSAPRRPTRPRSTRGEHPLE